MQPLNLPSYDYKVTKKEGKLFIFDEVRKRYVSLTPEEWVRQHLIHYLMDELKYPRSLVSVENGLRYNTLRKRSDIIVFDRRGDPWMVIECKASTVPLNEGVARQVSVYNQTLKAKYAAITNGLVHYCWSFEEASGLQLVRDFPPFPAGTSSDESTKG